MASSTRSTARGKSSATSSREPKATSTSSPTTSTSSTTSGERGLPTVVIALGSNLGDRRYNLLRALDALHVVVRIVRVSSFHETDAVDAPEGSPPFLNAVLIGYTTLEPLALLDSLLDLECRLGRVRRGVKNEPRLIDLDLIAHGATRMRTKRLTLPHPRAHQRAFVMEPLREIVASRAASRPY